MKPLLSNRPFTLLWGSVITMSLGFSIFFLSVSWFTVQELKLPGALGLVLTAVSVPRVIMMVLGGVLADRMQKSKLMFVTNLGQAVLMAVMVSMYITETLTLVPLLVLSFVFGFLDAFFYPAMSSLVPHLVQGPELQRANSLVQGSSELAFVFGPFIAGILLTIGDFTLAFSVAAVLIVLAAILVFPSWIKDSIPEKQATLSLRSVHEDLLGGLSYIRKSPIHRSGTLSISIVNLLIIGPIIMSIPIIVNGLNGTAFHLSIVEGGLAVGTFLASVIFVMWNFRKHRGKLVFAAMFTSFVAFFIFSQLQSIWLLAAFSALSGLMMMLVHLPTVTMIQEVTEKDKLGRVMSLISIAASGLEPISFAVLSLLVAFSVSIHSLLAVVAVIGIVATNLLYWGSKEFRAHQ